MEVKINISLKQGVLDPQGRAVESALNSLGYSEASNVRMGIRYTRKKAGGVIWKAKNLA